MSMEAENRELRLEELHPILRAIFTLKGEFLDDLNLTIRNDDRKSVLNLTHKEVYPRDHYTSYYFRYESDDVINRSELHHSEPIIQYIVNFGIQINGKFIPNLAFILYKTHTESEGIKQLEKIASDLQTIYSLPYTPKIFSHGVEYQQK